jgi:hybrid cluster-associated redox disulfide protein
MSHSTLDNMIVADLMARWPQTVPVLLRRRMSCPGCLMAPFMTVKEAAREHGIPIEDLARDLLLAVEAGDADRSDLHA